MKSIRLLIVKILQATKLNKFAHKIYYRYIHGFNTASSGLVAAQELIFNTAIEMGIANKGDYCEFGIFKGYAFWNAQKIAKKYELNNMRFFGFDSFKGLPEIQEEDLTKEEVFYQGQYSCSKENVTNNLNSKGVDWKKTFLIEGFFEESLNEDTKQKYNLDKIAIALIDCDLYSSTVEVLDYIQDMIMDKTILIFDDWNCFDKDDNRGQRKAFREFIENNTHLSAKEFISYGVYGQTFIINQE
ncbi:MAG: hypothetical protein F6K23_25955 [Okeania sp. SIO2C9]|uniref:TylF/MycF/NovP-related O-methyltransferase n=1 Tax=Okeania sp. SIO2C9 TaxID=2607791 RepID=UPI0013C0281A|nr:TylF/MycF/NovP-related O-methyltransferase [Okeania sp. SIO2C9]NEQ76180.1 hypothetical protein [Okeania sp. SIO2C9]